MKEFICSAIGLIGAAVAAVFGGWTQSLTTLLILMAIDYATGLVVAGVFHRSNKSQSGALESNAGYKGLAKKCMIMLFVLVAHRLDLAIGNNNYWKDAVCIAYTFNELLSLVENAGLMGVPVPTPIMNAIETLRSKIE